MDHELKPFVIMISAVLSGIVVLVAIYAIVRVKTDWFEKFFDATKTIPDVEKGKPGRQVATSHYVLGTRLQADMDRGATSDKGAASTAPRAPAPATKPLRQETAAERVADMCALLGVSKPKPNNVGTP